MPGGPSEDRGGDDVGVAHDDNRVVGRNARPTHRLVEVLHAGKAAARAARHGARDAHGEALVDEQPAAVLDQLGVGVLALDEKGAAGLAGRDLGGLAQLLEGARTHTHVARARTHHDGLAAHDRRRLGRSSRRLGLLGHLSLARLVTHSSPLSQSSPATS